MSERLAIVVGAHGELGRATAENLAADGFIVAAVGRSEEGLTELSAGVRRGAAEPTGPAAGCSVVGCIAADVGPPEALVDTIGTTVWARRRASCSSGSASLAPCSANRRTAKSINRFVSSCLAADRGARRFPRLPFDADGVWADEVPLGPNTLERSCVHLQNGDRHA